MECGEFEMSLDNISIQTQIQTSKQTLSHYRWRSRANLIWLPHNATLSHIYLRLSCKYIVAQCCTICGGWMPFGFCAPPAWDIPANRTIHSSRLYICLARITNKNANGSMCVTFNRRLIGFLWVFILWWYFEVWSQPLLWQPAANRTAWNSSEKKIG